MQPTKLLLFFAGSEDVEGLITFLQDNDIEEMPLSMLPVVSSVQHTLIKELIQKRKSGQAIGFVTAFNCIAENVFASMPAQWLTFAAAAVHLYNDNNNQMPENAKAFFPTESIMNSFLSLRTSVVMHLLSQLSAQNMQAKVGTAVAQKKLTFNLVTSSGLVALDAACAAYSQSTPMNAWLQSWTHALTRLSQANFEDEMKSMCDLLRVEFEKNHSEAHPELFSKGNKTSAEVVDDAGPEDPPLEEVEEWKDLSEVVESMWTRPGDDAVESEDEDKDSAFGPMQHGDKTLSSAQIRMFVAAAEHAMQQQMLCRVPGVDKGYSRVAPMG